MWSRWDEAAQEVAAEFTECLNNFQVEGSSTSLLDYIKNWMERVNTFSSLQLNRP